MRSGRLLLVGTGSVTSAFLPHHVAWVRAQAPDVELTVVLTAAGRRFVSADALAALSGSPVLADDWDAHPAHDPVHVTWSRCDAVLVYPATLDYLSQLASGSGSSPALLAIQLTRAPVVLAPALPPGGVDSPAYADACAALARRSNVRIVEPHPGLSAATGTMEASAPAPFTQVFESLG